MRRKYLGSSVGLEAGIEGELESRDQLLVINSGVQAGGNLSYMYFLYSDQVSDNYLLSVVHFSVMPTPCSLILYLVSREPVT